MTEPSSYYQQHHAVEPPVIDAGEFRPYWRRSTRLNKLHRSGAISALEWRAAQDFGALVETVRAGEWPARSLDNAYRGDGPEFGIIRRHDAITRLARLRRALGSGAVDLLEAYVVDDETWIALGRRMRKHAKTARKRIVRLIKKLTGVIWLT